jgi:hypothetical protein
LDALEWATPKTAYLHTAVCQGQSKRCSGVRRAFHRLADIIAQAPGQTIYGSDLKSSFELQPRQIDKSAAGLPKSLLETLNRLYTSNARQSSSSR